MTPSATDPFPAAEPAAAAAEPPPDLPGYVLGPQLAEGGMGVVYRATQIGLNRPAAVKLMRPEGGGRGLVRFLAEAEAAAAVRHPHVVQVYDFGQHAGRPYLVMEFCPAGSLADSLAACDRWPPAEAARLVAALADAVQAVHAAGIVHRDLKPGNVLFDAAGTPKVADFGVAKRAGGADLTGTVAVLGTPAYMAPEQARGEGKFVGPAADVWALGVILYECLTGAKPFPGGSAHAVLRQVTDDEPAHPRRLAAGVPRDLDLICRKCLAKPPHERYPSAAALAADLRRHLAGVPVTARPVPAVVRAWKWAGRNRAVAASLATAVVALVGGAAAAVGFAVHARTEARRADREAAAARRQETEARAAADRAVARERETRRLLARIAVAEGVRLADAGDPGRAAVWFAEPLRLAAGDAEVVRTARQRLATYRLHQPAPRLVGYAEDTAADPPVTTGRWAVAVSGREVRLTDDRRETTLRLPDRVRAVAVSPDGRRVATGCQDGTARVWDARTGGPLTPPLAHGLDCDAVGFSPDGFTLRVTTWDGYRWEWAAAPAAGEATAAGKADTPPPRDGPYRVSFRDGRARVFADRPGEEAVFVTPEAVRAAGVCDGGRLLGAAGRLWDARAWELATGQPVSPPLGVAWAEIADVWLTPGGAGLAVRGGWGLRFESRTALFALPTDDRPAGDLVALAELQAGGRLDTNAFVPLAGADRAARLDRLRAAYPDEFAVTPAERAAWHRRQMAAAREDKDWPAAAFHAHRLLAEHAPAADARELLGLAALAGVGREPAPAPRPAEGP